MTSLQPPPSVLEIADRLERAGHEAWCVGGAVRDALLGDAALDWDLATSARPEQVQALFGRRRTIPVGIAFGTVSVLDAAGVAHEVTTFRRDVTTDGRHAVVEFGASLDDDLARRDYTINAIAFRPSTGELRDPFGGRTDLGARVLRAVGDPDERMREDRLRALRGIRFAARYGLRLDAATATAIDRSAAHLTRLSAERVQQELVKTMEQVRCPGVAFRLWRDSGALAALVPALGGMDDVVLATLDRLPMASAGAMRRPQRTSNRLAALFLDLEPGEVRGAMTALRFSKHEVAWASGLSERWQAQGAAIAAALTAGELPSDRTVRRWLAGLGRLQAGAFLRVAAARWGARGARGEGVPTPTAVRGLHRRMEAFALSSPLAVADLAVGGDDLRRSGIPAGPIYAKILHALLDQVLDDPARNTPEALLSAVPQVVATLAVAASPGTPNKLEP